MDLDTIAARRGGLILVADLDQEGADARELRNLASRGAAIRLRRGVYVPASVWAISTATERYLLRVRAAAMVLPDGVIFSHASAAVLLGLPILGSWPDDVHVIGQRPRGGHGEPGLRRHGTMIPPAPFEVDGMLCTTPARTAIDLARTSPFASAVVTADRVLANALDPVRRAFGATVEELGEELELVGRRPGYRAATQALTFADGRSGSAGESLSRARFRELGIPLPELQTRFVDEKGEMFVDFFWKELSAIGEFDGRAKYSRPEYAKGRLPEEVLWQEKLRQDRLLPFARHFVRWDWAIALSATSLLARLASAGIRPSS